jgi:hypothetical protein
MSSGRRDDGELGDGESKPLLGPKTADDAPTGGGGGRGSSHASSSLDPHGGDAAAAWKMGYTPQLHRGLTGLTNFAFGFTEVAVLVSVSLVLGVGLGHGGPAVTLWGFALNFGFVMVVAHCMAELCSAYPAAGSVYNWAGQVAPLAWAPLASYVCGWANFVGNAAGDASFAFGFASLSSAATKAGGGEALGDRPQVHISQKDGVSGVLHFAWRRHRTRLPGFQNRTAFRAS